MNITKKKKKKEKKERLSYHHFHELSIKFLKEKTINLNTI
jgi:hypothetical protein